jgi:Photosynthesis system II assembly factor YCF48
MCYDKNSTFWIAGETGIIEGRVEQDEFKVKNIIPTTSLLYGITCGESGEIWAVGRLGSAYHYKNGVWNQQSILEDVKQEVVLTKVKSFQDGLWVLGFVRHRKTNGNELAEEKGILFKSKDSGNTWEDKTPLLAEGLNDIYLNEKNGWLVGLNGGTYSTNDGGDSWKKEESPTKNDLLNIFALDSNNIWIAGDKGTILKYNN